MSRWLSCMLLVVFAVSAHSESQCIEDDNDHVDDVSVGLLQIDTLEKRQGAMVPPPPVLPSHSEPQSLCDHGKLLPEVYVIGAIKTATTSLDEDLETYAGIHPAPGNTAETFKEWYFFSRWLLWDRPVLPLDEAHTEWLSSFPECPPENTRELMADYSVDNSYMIDAPPNFEFYGAYENMTSIPRRMIGFYGDFSSRLKIVMMLREPLSRSQSEWYFTGGGWDPLPRRCSECRLGPTFSTAIQAALEVAQNGTKLRLEDWLWKSFYAAQLTDWIKYFPRQILVLPYRYYVDAETTPLVSQLLQEMIGFPRDAVWKEASHENPSPHPPLDGDIAPDTRQAFENFFAGPNRDLVKLLASAQLDRGVSLALYNGTAGSESEIEKWLLDGW